MTDEWFGHMAGLPDGGEAPTDDADESDDSDQADAAGYEKPHPHHILRGRIAHDRLADR